MSDQNYVTLLHYHHHYQATYPTTATVNESERANALSGSLSVKYIAWCFVNVMSASLSVRLSVSVYACVPARKFLVREHFRAQTW